MEQQLDPRMVEHPQLRAFALHAALVAKLEETAVELDALASCARLDELEPWSTFHDDEANESDVYQNPDPTVDLWRMLPLDIAQELAYERLRQEDEALQASLSAWLVEDPANWLAYRDV